MHMNYSGNDVHHFNYVGERFADLQLLRYRLNGFEQLSLLQKQLVYYLSPTAVNAVKSETSGIDDDGWYTLGGVKLNSEPTQEGVYINKKKKRLK